MTDAIQRHWATCNHEAAHAAACIWFGGRAVQCVRVDHPEPGTNGQVLSELGPDLIQPRDAVVALVGYMTDGSADWPPEWPVHKDEVEALGLIVRALKLDEENYRRLIGVAEDLLENMDFRRLMDAIATALGRVPAISGEELEELRLAVLGQREQKEKVTT
jgi:hypothetical protein